MKETLIVGPFPPPIGGVAESARKLSYVLGCKNDVLVHEFNTSSGKKNEDLYAPKKLSSYFFSLRTAFKLILFLKDNKISETHLFATSSLAFLRDILLFYIVKLCCGKVYVHFHSKKEGEFFLRKNYIDILFFLLKPADIVFVLSEDHKRFFSKFYKGELVVLENFCISSEFSPSKGSTKDFLYCGRISERKGFFDLIAAFSFIDLQHDFSLNVLGVSDNSNTEKQIASIPKDLKGRCFFYGNVFGEQKNNFFSSAGCFIFPSHFENSPVVLKEAMMANLIIVASDIEANKKVLRDYPGSFYFRTSDPSDLAAVLNRIINLTDTEFAKKMEDNSLFSKFDENYALDIIYLS